MAKGQQEKAFDDAIFAAKKGELEGPVKTQFGYYVFEVTKVKPPRSSRSSSPSETIKNLLKSQRQQKSLDKFIKDFRESYKEKTVCADDFAVAECKNAPKEQDRHRLPRPARRASPSRAALRRARLRRARLRRLRRARLRRDGTQTAP